MILPYIKGLRKIENVQEGPNIKGLREIENVQESQVTRIL